MARPLQLPTVVGIRFSKEDVVKLQRLCAATQRPASELIRVLVRLAQPTGLPDVWLPAVNEKD